jgi:UDP-N-acetylmuramyl pentapeptide phosphotransferase/UDP-N-acetylglucosamine-1-phosphate transferase
VPALLYLVLGLVDDLRILTPAAKFGLQSLIAALAVGLGVRAPLTGIAMLDAGISWLWIVTVVNAFNLTDVCDGLVASLSAVMFAALGLLDPAQAGIAWIVAASALGFLAWNRPPASIFLGDSGSHLLGFLAGALALSAPRGDVPPVLLWLAGGMILGVPLFEVLFVSLVRMRRACRGGGELRSLLAAPGGGTVAGPNRWGRVRRRRRMGRRRSADATSRSARGHGAAGDWIRECRPVRARVDAP